MPVKCDVCYLLLLLLLLAAIIVVTVVVVSDAAIAYMRQCKFYFKVEKFRSLSTNAK